jgi:ribosomal protein S18 acetylase RimI-like enzyme
MSEILRGETEDVDAVARLWVELAAEQLAHGSRLETTANREIVRDACLRHAVAGTLFVLDRGGTIEGFVTCSVETGRYELTETRGLVENIYVAPNHRSQGHGRALLSRAETELRERGCTVIALEAMAANDRARQFYRAAGYDAHRVAYEKSL